MKSFKLLTLCFMGSLWICSALAQTAEETRRGKRMAVEALKLMRVCDDQIDNPAPASYGKPTVAQCIQKIQVLGVGLDPRDLKASFEGQLPCWMATQNWGRYAEELMKPAPKGVPAVRWFKAYHDEADRCRVNIR